MTIDKTLSGYDDLRTSHTKFNKRVDSVHKVPTKALFHSTVSSQ